MEKLITLSKNYGLSVAWMIVLLILSTMSGTQANELNFLDFFQADKLSHLVAYMVLSFLLMRSLSVNHSTNATTIALSVSIIYGILMEVAQYSFFIGRHFEFLDIIANIIGATLGVYIFRKLK